MAGNKKLHPVSERIRKIREDMRIGRAEMAKAIGCSVENLAKYETRSPLPIDLIEPFCLFTGYSPWYLLTGKPDFDLEINGDTAQTTIPGHKADNERVAAFEAQLRRYQRADRKKVKT